MHSLWEVPILAPASVYGFLPFPTLQWDAVQPGRESIHPVLKEDRSLSAPVGRSEVRRNKQTSKRPYFFSAAQSQPARRTV